MPQAIESAAAANRATSAPANAPRRPLALRAARRSIAQPPRRARRCCDVAGGWRLERAGDPAVGEQHDAVGVGRRYRIVGDHHDRVPVLVDDLAQQREHAVPGGHVQRSGRLVGEQHLRPGHERPGDRDPLLLAAGKLRGPVAQAHVQPDAGGDVAHGRAPRPVAAEPQRQLDVLGDGERRQQVEGLEYEPDPLTPQDRQPPFAEVRQAGAAERDAPEVGRSSPAATFRNVLLPSPTAP